MVPLLSSSYSEVILGLLVVDGGVVASLLLWMESPAVSSRRVLVGNSLKGKKNSNYFGVT